MFNDWRNRIEQLLATEISALSRYADRLFQYQPLPHDAGGLFDAVACPSKIRLGTDDPLPDLSGLRDDRSVVLLNANFNHHLDIQGLLAGLKPRLNRHSRVVAVGYSPYLRWVYSLITWLGLRKGPQPISYVTRGTLAHLANLAGFEVVRIRPVGYLPPGLLGSLSRVVNRLMPAIPFARWLGATTIIVLRPVIPETTKPSLTVLIPARNEKGNIEPALQRMPDLAGGRLEVIFVEGHSKDGTWEEIQRILPLYAGRFTVKAFQQTGIGKNDAVKLGMSQATGDLVTILDADLTMPPESLGRFYDAWCQGLGDFINGNRLVYPMENEAMQFLNWLGNLFFARSVSMVLDTPIGDCLCGTKLVALRDYRRMRDWCAAFGEFDPFGDFEFLFPAAELAMGTTDIPIRYKARTYGETNISRFRHGWMLLQMTAIGFLRIYLGKRA